MDADGAAVSRSEILEVLADVLDGRVLSYGAGLIWLRRYPGPGSHIEMSEAAAKLLIDWKE